jgi:hypothetical protein
MAEESEVVKLNVDQSIELLTSSSHEITSCWSSFIREEYGNNYAESRDDLIDVITLVDYIVARLKEHKTDEFRAFFQAVEQVIDNGDESSKELIIVGLLEGLQNNCGMENIEYHHVFDTWFGTKSKRAWDGLIYLWESNDTMEEKQEKLKDYRV